MNIVKKTLIIFTILVCSGSVVVPLVNPLQSETANYQLPALASLPAVKLSKFKPQHPRLPAPSMTDIKMLEYYNPMFFEQHRNKAANDQLYSLILIAYIYPEQVNLDELFDQLMELEFTDRGDSQTKPIAIAYDWLYSQWSKAQRLQLKTKLQQACDYQIHIIRDELQLSPYNVFLYNSPLQALVAAALALHQDIPEADDNCMRFTHDYWKNRVLPVWRQIMADNGGWHEGGEYIGIGIGQAIYQIPAMWRNATGEDYFHSEKGIKGFLDFLVYRTRPDGTHFRWGDAGYFDRRVPDRIPLAIEYQHKPSYNLNPVKNFIPTSWPWGPLPDPKLIDKKAYAQLPLTKLFDGLGLVVSRSDWTRHATYTTFKAGDNFWSHSHLDQGAFTIFKGGALVIDSGLYGTRYGSDHHFNYTYQSIAHNLVTITDPDDKFYLASKINNSQITEIANDGGQRRVGSGWGIKAPLDLIDWNNQKSIYHTAKLTQFIDKDNAIIAVADLTPAYTNKLSSDNLSAQRTKRVKKYWRVFIHDKINDLIIIFDQIKSYNRLFKKKWLLHSLYEPTLKDNFFHLSTPANPDLKMFGGELYGRVLFPEQHWLKKVGGKGFEFFVDGKNYDEGGLVKKKASIMKNSETGQWRIELQPKTANDNDIFLVALQPLLLGQKKAFPEIKTQQDKNRITITIKGQKPFILNLNDKQELVTVDF